MEELELSKRLSKHPALKKRIERILNVVENCSGEIELADTAEEHIIEESRYFNQETLQAWANGQAIRQENRFEQRHPSVSKDTKKKSDGTAPLVTLK